MASYPLLLLVGVLSVAIFSGVLTQSAFATFPGENGKIAFVSDRDGNREIYVMNPNGSEQTNISNNSAFDQEPSWSPDGTKIAFVSDRDDPYNIEIYVMDAVDGSNPTRLTDNPTGDVQPNWSPDGTKIAFVSDRDGNAEIYVMDAVDGSGQTRLTNDYRPDYTPSWSPDGTKIAFNAYRDVGSGIFVMNSDGSEQINISNSRSWEDFFPDWGPVTDTEPPVEEDTTPPVLTMPEDIVVEATTEQGAEVTYNVSAEDDRDGNATLEEDGSITQDNIGGDITISCEPPSGSTFPVGDTTVQCTATDEAGNEGTASFTVTVNPPPPPDPTTLREVIEKLISDIQNLEGIPQDTKTSIIAFLERALVLLTNDDNTRNDARACNILGAFMNQVNANERQDTLTEDQATDLRTQAEDIRDMLGC